MVRTIAALQRAEPGVWLYTAAGLRMRSVTARDVADDTLVERLGAWRAQHMASYPTQFTVTADGTRAWLRDVILGNPGRLMLLVVDTDGLVVGHLGFDCADIGEGGLRLSNVVVGERSRMPYGTMRACLAGMLDWARQALEPNRVWAPVFTDNLRPIRMMRSVGFVDGIRTPTRLHVTGDRREYLPRAPGDDAPPDQWHMWVQWLPDAAPPFTGVGLGTAPTAGADRSPEGCAQLRATVEHAHERGVHWIDTAGIYGFGDVEETVGAALAGLAEGDRPAVATKCGLRWDARAGRAVAVGDAATLRAQARDSCERLGVERLDLLFLHRPPEDGTELEAAWSTLAALADEGVAARVGLAGGDLDALERCHAIRRVDVFQAPLSLARPDTGAIAGARALDVPVLAHGALETGLLRGADDAAHAEPSAHDRRRRSPLFGDADRLAALLAALESVAHDVPCSLPELAVAWALAVPGVAGVPVGARRPGQVEAWSGAAGVGLEPEHRAAIEAAIEAAVAAGRS
jgi:aryl-alcohol dehydrogenase-like predicted oxidoreductase